MSEQVAGAWSHNGVPIRISDSGHFEARIGRHIVRRGNLAALRKAIEAAVPFSPFKALYLSSNGDIREVEIVAQRARTHGFMPGMLWLTRDGLERRVIYPLSARSALMRYAKRIKREDSLIAKYYADREKVLARIKPVLQVLK